MYWYQLQFYKQWSYTELFALSHVYKQWFGASVFYFDDLDLITLCVFSGKFYI